MSKNSVYNGEVVGFKVCRLFRDNVQTLSIKFDTYEAAEKYTETINETAVEGTIYFPVKLISMHNASIKEPSYD